LLQGFVRHAGKSIPWQSSEITCLPDIIHDHQSMLSLELRRVREYPFAPASCGPHGPNASQRSADRRASFHGELMMVDLLQIGSVLLAHRVAARHRHFVGVLGFVGLPQSTVV